MRRKRVSAGTLAGLAMVCGSGLFLAGCFPSKGASDIPLPVITVSPATTSVPAGSSVQFDATVVSHFSTTISWSVNNIQGGSAALGTVSASGYYTAPATVPSPATVTVRATSSTEGSTYGSALVTITAPPSNASLAIAPLNSSGMPGGNVQFSASVDGTPTTAVTWSVDNVAGGSSTVGTISAAGLYTAPSQAPSPPTVVVTATSQANTAVTTSTTMTVTASNSVPLYVNLGPNGDTGSASTNLYNGLSTTVTVCLPGTIDCQVVPNVLVDTSSVGLRVLNSALVTAPATELTAVTNSQGFQIQECVQFANTSYAWGPVLVADVHLGGEVAASVPIQVLGAITGSASYPVPYADCLSLGSGPELDTVEALGANGILGIGTQVQDCGLDCAGGATFPGYPYYICPGNACQTEPVPVAQQVSNPVAFFPVDHNGVEISLPAISAAGATTLPYTTSSGSGLITAGQLIFGVGTESNNALGSATIYAVNDDGNFPNVVFDGSSYAGAGVLDSGSKALYVGNATTLGTTDCTDAPFYCPSSPLSLSLTPYGANGTSGTINLTIQSADSLFAGCPGCAAFDDLGGPSGDGLEPDFFDIGVPFFFGRNVFVGIAGTTVPNKVSAPNGYFAF